MLCREESLDSFKFAMHELFMGITAALWILEESNASKARKENTAISEGRYPLPPRSVTSYQFWLPLYSTMRGLSERPCSSG